MQGHHHTPLQALCPPVIIQITPHTHFVRQRDSWVRSPPGDNWGLATHTFQCWQGGPCSTDSSRTCPPHWPTRRGCCSQDYLLLCLQRCKHCSFCRREGQTGKLWTSAPLATVGVHYHYSWYEHGSGAEQYTPNGAISCSERWGPHRSERGVGECPATPGRVHHQHTRGSFRWRTEGSLHGHQHQQGR